MGFLLVARAKSTYFLVAEIAANLTRLILVFILAQWYGLIGTAIAFFSMYVLHTAGMYYLSKRQNGFIWQTGVLRSILALGAVLGLSFTILRFSGPWTGALLVCGIGLGVSYFALRNVLAILEVASVWVLIRRAKSKWKK